MILEKVILENFRQFRGRQEIVFSDLRERNVTLIHAENGFGKTALLNALLWGFFGQSGLTDDLEKPDRVLHEGTAAQSKDPAETYARVRIIFRDADRKYTLERSQSLAQQLNKRKADLRLEILAEDGQTYKEPRPQAKIESIIPAGISKFLFFNGERIDHLAMSENAPLVADAIQQVLGLKMLRTTIEDLRHPNVRGQLRQELRDQTSDEKKKLIDEQTQLDQHIDKLGEDKQVAQKNLAATDDELEMVNNKLEANRKAHEMQTRRKDLQARRTNLAGREAELRKQIGKMIAEDGYTVFADELVKRGREITKQLRSENKIPARVLNSFIEELLHEGRCICCTPLAEGTEQYEAVKQLLTIAGDQNFNNAVGALDNAIGVIESVSDRTKNNLEQSNRERLTIKAELTVVDEELEDIHQRLGGKDDEEVSQLEDTRHRLGLARDGYIQEMSRLDTKLDEKQQRRDELRRKIKRIEDNESAAQLAQRRLEAVEDSISKLEQILELETDGLRPLLNDAINESFSAIIQKDYRIDLSSTFTLRMIKDVEGKESEVAPSTGERQVMSLSFIGSMVALARRREEIPTILRGLSGATYPMIMDSPFGQLGDQFRSGVAKWIPELAPQVVVFASSSQYKGPVEDHLKSSGRVGQRYYLAYHGPSLQKSARPELTIGSKNYTQYHESNEEYTEIREIDV